MYKYVMLSVTMQQHLLYRMYVELISICMLFILPQNNTGVASMHVEYLHSHVDWMSQ